MNIDAMSFYSLRQFRDDLRITLTMAAMYAVLAFIGMTMIGLPIVGGVPRSGTGPVTITDVAGTLGVFVLAYFVAATGSACAVFLLRPLRRSWIGWALTGGLVAAICYTTLFTLLAIFGSVTAWFFAMRGQSPPQVDDLKFILILVGVLGVPIGAAFGVYWKHNPD